MVSEYGVAIFATMVFISTTRWLYVVSSFGRRSIDCFIYLMKKSVSTGFPLLKGKWYHGFLYA